MFNANISSISAISTNHSNKRVKAVKAPSITSVLESGNRNKYQSRIGFNKKKTHISWINLVLDKRSVWRLSRSTQLAVPLNKQHLVSRSLWLIARL
jgi:hypothetical protein